MKDPASLTHAQLVEIVRVAQDLLFLADDGSIGVGEAKHPHDWKYDPDKECDCADACAILTESLERHGLMPEHAGTEIDRPTSRVVTLRVRNYGKASVNTVQRVINTLIEIGQADAADSIDEQECDPDCRLANKLHIAVGDYVYEVPCVICGRRDLPLHTDNRCPNCHKE